MSKQIKELMTTNPEYIKPETTLIDAAKRMRELDVGMLPVGDGVKLKGMLTDRDITIRAVAEGKDVAKTTAKDIMTPEVLYAFEDQSVDEVVKSMRDKQVRRMIILNRDKDMTGIVALADIAHHAEDSSLKARILEGVSSR